MPGMRGARTALGFVAGHLPQAGFGSKLRGFQSLPVWDGLQAGRKEAERQRFFVGCNYRAEYFAKAVQIAVAYFRAANDYCTQMEGRPATYEDIRKAFWKKILRADLLSPLEDVYALAVSPGAP